MDRRGPCCLRKSLFCSYNSSSVDLQYVLAKGLVIRGVVVHAMGVRMRPIIFIHVSLDKGLMHSPCQDLAFGYTAEQLTLSELGIIPFL